MIFKILFKKENSELATLTAVEADTREQAIDKLKAEFGNIEVINGVTYD
ncbi:MAG TPA: hypothetical protein VIC51_01270 [Psychromonas sp.]